MKCDPPTETHERTQSDIGQSTQVVISYSHSSVVTVADVSKETVASPLRESSFKVQQSSPSFSSSPLGVPFPPLLLLQDGDPHQPHHNKQQPYGQAG